jgi:hypothetical protein
MNLLKKALSDLLTCSDCRLRYVIQGFKVFQFSCQVAGSHSPVPEAFYRAIGCSSPLCSFILKETIKVMESCMGPFASCVSRTPGSVYVLDVSGTFERTKVNMGG